MKDKFYLYDRIEIPVEPDITHIKFTYSDSTYTTADAFEHQPISITYDYEGIEHIEKDGSLQKLVRFTPTKTGEVCVDYFSGDAISYTNTITVLSSGSHGCITPSRQDRRYFEYSDGTAFVPVGINMVYPTTYTGNSGNEFGVSNSVRYIGLNQYRSWFKKAAENGVNMVRFWLGHDYFCPDTENVYEYDLVQFSKIDRIFALAKEYDIVLKITVDNFRHFAYTDNNEGGYSGFISRLFSKRIYADGKRCENMQSWLTDKSFGDAWLDKINELSKRYSGDTTLFAIELWNEMNSVDAPYDIVLEWNRQYLPKVKELFPQNMVVNSLGSLGCDGAKNHYDSFCWDRIDFKQMHRYLDQGAIYECCTKNPIEFITDGFAMMKTETQPLILAETGAVDNCHSGPFKYYSADDDGLIFADCVYTPFFVGSAGCGHIWHWDNRYVESKSLFKMYKPFSQLIEGIDVLSEDFKPINLSTDESYILTLQGKNHILGYVRNKSSDWSRLLRDLKEVKIIDKLEIEIGAISEAELVKIWDDDTALTLKDDKIVLDSICHGVMFKALKGDIL